MFTTEQLETLTRAIAQGVLRVRYEDREETYRSMAEMIALRNEMRRELGLVDADGGQGVTTSVYDGGLR